MVTVSLGTGSPMLDAHLVQEASPARRAGASSPSSGMGTIRLRVELRDQLRARGPRRASRRWARRPRRPRRSRRARLGQQMADVAQVDDVEAVELVDEARCCRRARCPGSSSRKVRTPVTRTSWTSYSPGESSRKAGSRLVGTRMPSLLDAPAPSLRRPVGCRRRSRPSVGWPSGWL